MFAGNGKGDGGKLSVAELAKEVEQTKTVVRHLDRQVTHLNSEVSQISSDLKTVLQLLQSLHYNSKNKVLGRSAVPPPPPPPAAYQEEPRKASPSFFNKQYVQAPPVVKKHKRLANPTRGASTEHIDQTTPGRRDTDRRYSLGADLFKAPKRLPLIKRDTSPEFEFQPRYSGSDIPSSPHVSVNIGDEPTSYASPEGYRDPYSPRPVFDVGGGYPQRTLSESEEYTDPSLGYIPAHPGGRRSSQDAAALSSCDSVPSSLSAPSTVFELQPPPGELPATPDHLHDSHDTLDSMLSHSEMSQDNSPLTPRQLANFEAQRAARSPSGGGGSSHRGDSGVDFDHSEESQNRTRGKTRDSRHSSYLTTDL